MIDPENLRIAWRKVRGKAGKPGIDKMSVAMFPDFCRKHWPRIRNMLMEETYRPAVVRRVFIPKPDGSERPLSIPTVLDRVIHQALAQVLTPLFDNGFSSRNMAFEKAATLIKRFVNPKP